MHSEEIALLEPTMQMHNDRDLILIIDDDHDQADVLAKCLRNQGFATHTANTGRTGLKIAQQEHPNLVLLDLRLPDVDGFQVCRQLCDDQNTNDIPVIIVSGMEQSDIIRRARTAGSQFFLRKPYDPNALLILIETALCEAGQW